MEKEEIYKKCGLEIFDVLEGKEFSVLEKVGILECSKQAFLLAAAEKDGN